MLRTFCFGACCALAVISSAPAHVTLETQQASVGTSYKAVMQVQHGCSGSPTVAIRVRVADGLVGVKPMPKPGWKLETISAKYSRPYTLRGVKRNEGVTEIMWSGGNLLDAHYDEFVFTGAIAEELEAGKMIFFPVVQECEKGVLRWIETSTGAHARDHSGEGSQPAPALRLLPKR